MVFVKIWSLFIFIFRSGRILQNFSRSKLSKYSNIQFHFFPSFVIDHGLVDPDRHGFQLHASPNHPKSRGSITLNNTNPYSAPKILFNYLEHQEDLKQTIDCVKIARNITRVY